MGILRRAADIVSANVNDLVDRLEQPEQMLRHAVREMEALVAATSSAVARSIASEKLLTRMRNEHTAQVEQWHQRAAAALEAGDEPLARRALARKLEHQQSTESIEKQLIAVRETSQSLRRQLELVRDKHASARSRLITAAARESAANAQRQMVASSLDVGSAAHSMARFERFSEQLEFSQAEAAALVALQTEGQRDLAAEFEHLAAEAAIDDELARLKAHRTRGDH